MIEREAFSDYQNRVLSKANKFAMKFECAGMIIMVLMFVSFFAFAIDFDFPGSIDGLIKTVLFFLFWIPGFPMMKGAEKIRKNAEEKVNNEYQRRFGVNQNQHQ